MKIGKDEILKLAHISNLKVYDNEIAGLTKQLESLLGFAACVEEAAASIKEPSTKNVNMLREDVLVQYRSDIILRRAPQQEERYFAVPAIIEK